MSNAPIMVLDSITQVTAEHAGAVLVNASHGGTYCARLALEGDLRGAIFNDAGIGHERAGIAGLALLEDNGVPAAAVDVWSARIGDGDDCMAHGVISECNTVAADLGVRAGQTARKAGELMAAGPARLKARRTISAVQESVRRLGKYSQAVWALDSAAAIDGRMTGAMVVTGSHGGLLGGNRQAAVKAAVSGALFNDAGVGIERAGIARLAALEERGIAAGTVDYRSARIGDALSSLETGIISHLNKTAHRRGHEVGDTARAFVERSCGAELEVATWK